MARRKTTTRPQKITTSYSVSPAGEEFAIPQPKDYAREHKRLEKLVKQARQAGQEIVRDILARVVEDW